MHISKSIKYTTIAAVIGLFFYIVPGIIGILSKNWTDLRNGHNQIVVTVSEECIGGDPYFMFAVKEAIFENGFITFSIADRTFAVKSGSGILCRMFSLKYLPTPMNPEKYLMEVPEGYFVEIKQ